MFHTINHEFPWDNLRPGKIYCIPLYENIKENPVDINISKLKYFNDLYKIKEDSERYLNVDLSLPALVVDFGDYYRLIDGKHRLKKTLDGGGTTLLCHIISKKEALKLYKSVVDDPYSLNIIDGFLSPDEADYLEERMRSNTGPNKFPWYHGNIGTDERFSDSGLNPDLDNFQLCHVFYHHHALVEGDKYSRILNMFLSRILPFSLVRIKANLLPKTNKIKKFVYHTDFEPPPDNLQTAIYYVNSNNGHTIFENGTKIESIKNRLISFPAHMRHKGTTCTDKMHRTVINFNYYPNLQYLK